MQMPNWKFLSSFLTLERRLRLLRGLSRTLIPNYRFFWPQMDWWADPWFNQYLERFGEVDGFNTQRRWMVYQLLRICEAIEGDTAECGAYEGAGSYLICAMRGSMRKTHHVFDSFEGLSTPSKKDGVYWQPGAMARGEDIVSNNLRDFDNVVLYRGWIPERFGLVADRKFSFVHIDVDLYEPTKASLEFFYPRLALGGIILCDDYAFSTCPGATQACDEFTSGLAESFIALDCGGGFLIKGRETTPPRRLAD